MTDDLLPPVLPVRTTDVIPWLSADHLRGMSLPWRLEPARPVQVVVAKATLDLDPKTGALTLRDEGLPPTGDEHTGDPPLSSLRRPSDIGVIKGRVDVTLWGHAHAAGRSSVDVRFAFGGDKGFDRQLRVSGARTRGASSDPFDSMPLLYELGRHHERDNPVGQPGGRGSRIEALDRGPDGVGPIPMMWPGRLKAFGTYDQRWYEARHPYFADDFHPDAFQSAPLVQQISAIKGDETFRIEGMHEVHRSIAGQLPRLRVRMFAVHEGDGGSRFVDVPSRIDSVFFDMEDLVVTLTWRATVDVRDDRGTGIHAWWGELVDGEPSSVEKRRRDFWLRYAPTSSLLPMVAGDLDVRARLLAAGVPDELPPPPATGPAAEPAPRAWRARDEDPGRAMVVAWMGGDAELDPSRLGEAELSGLDLSGRDLRGWMLRGAHLEGALLEGADLREAELGEVVAPGASFTGANLEGADFTGAVLADAIFRGAQADGAAFESVYAPRADFSELGAKKARFSEAQLDGARFDGAMLDGAYFTEAGLHHVRFNGASMVDVRLYDADAREAVFDHADISEARADGLRMVGASCDETKADEAIMDGADLTDVRWRRASALKLSLNGTVATRAKLLALDMREAQFAEAQLEETDLRGCNLLAANFERALLCRTDLRQSNLHGAELSGAVLDGTKLEGALISNTILTEDEA